MKIGEIWEAKKLEANNASHSYRIVTLSDNSGIGLSPGDSIYLISKKPDDIWEVCYLRNTEEDYKNSKEDIEKYGLMNWVPGVWEEIEAAHNESAEWYFIDDGKEPLKDINYTNHKYYISGKIIYENFSRKDGAKIHWVDGR